MLSKEFKYAIYNGDIDYLQSHHQKINIHAFDDYYLYLAVFYKRYNIAQYLIELGLDPEKTKSRLEISNPIGLEKIRTLKKEELIKNFYQNLNENCKNPIYNKKLKI